MPRETRIGDTRDRNGQGPLRFRPIEARTNIQRTTARRNSDNGVLRVDIYIEPTRAVFGAFDCSAHGIGAARDVRTCERRRHSERRRELCRIKNAETSARPGADVM